ncbi:unnamed protein product [Diabrotica balteata]|uniref:Reverse transcriptase domain-containing protein n=1 Tax=Diabrotica balteata TaxID=107213 RepID=A0A9N9XBJ5_DIABA|nr:unnamed protein product [Diabrotica balteata]
MMKVECKVRVQDVSKPFKTNRGLRQGDALSCTLFNLALEKVMRDSGINLKGTIYTRSIQVMAYADDIIIIGRTQNEAVEAFTRIKNAAENIGLLINIQKTKYMPAISRIQQNNLEVQHETIEKVGEFCYLGSLVDYKNNTSKETKKKEYAWLPLVFWLGPSTKSEKYVNRE